MNFIKNKKFRRGSLFIVAFSLIGLLSYTFVKAGGSKPSMTITYDSTIISGAPSTSQDIKGLVNQEIELKYKVTPGDLDIGDVNTKVNKEIVLVLDTSGSMKYSISDTDKSVRIDSLRVAASNFIKKFDGVDNVKIGIADYSTKANYNGLSLPLTSTQSGMSTLIAQINKYTVSNIGGGTNTGDGIRYALNMLNDGTDAKKFVVFMSDGEPTFYMKKAVYIQNKGWSYEYYTDLDNNSNPVIDGPGNQDDSAQNCLNYAATMSAKIKAANYSSFNIAYSAGSSADKMKTLATASGGKYYSAMDANAINNVFNDIADQIKGSYAVGGANLKFSLLDGIQYTGPTADVTIDGNTYTQKLPDIIYKLSSDNKKYVADPFYISFKFKATKSGTYKLPEGATFNYKAIDGNVVSISLEQQKVNYVANDLVTDGTPIINANIVGQAPDPGVVGQNLTLRYKVNPQTFQVFETTNGTKVPSYTFKVKFKFNLQGKFESVLGLNTSTDSNYDVETPEFDVVYKLDSSGSYVADPIDDKQFTIKVKDEVEDINNLQFGPGVVSYIDLNNKSASTIIAPYLLNMKPAIKLEDFGMYKGIENKVPSILKDSSLFNVAKGANIRLGGILTGSINNKSKLKLDIQSGISLNSTIDVYSYDDNGTLTPLGKMEKIASTVTDKSTYMYNGEDAIDKKILIVYNEALGDTVIQSEEYANDLYIGSDRKTVKLKVNNGLVELF